MLKNLIVWRKKMKKIILIMGLPGSGKTTLAKELKNSINANWLNADKVRRKYNDFDFSLKELSGKLKECLNWRNP